MIEEHPGREFRQFPNKKGKIHGGILDPPFPQALEEQVRFGPIRNGVVAKRGTGREDFQQ